MKDLVLVGGGHSHVAVLKAFGMRPLDTVRLTVISHDPDTPYSGMLPGLIAGHYSREEAHIDVRRLARFAGARAIFDDVIGLDLPNRLVRCRNRPPVPYDVLSINIGSTPNASVPGALEHATPVKPIDRFLARWEELRQRLLGDDTPKRIAVVGGGAGGVELLLSVQFRMRALLEGAGRRADRLEYHLFTASATILPTHNARVRTAFERILDRRAVHVHTAMPIEAVSRGRLHGNGGASFEVDEILWTTEARAAPWIADSGLTTDDRGFVRVSSRLQSTSHPDVFAAGDVAATLGRRLEKSGVYAVRQGPPLAENLRRVLTGEPLQLYRPQRHFLSLISTGDRFAVGSRGPLAFKGRWVWRWKDRIDRRFMRQYDELPVMSRPGAMGGAAEMRCAGCGAKVGASVLTRALSRVQLVDRADVIIGLDSPDDAAVVEVPPSKVIVHTVDFFRAIVDDPYVFGKIATNHALGDLYAMGAEPQTALAIVTIPYGPEEEVEDTLTQMLTGAADVLRDAGAVLVGGHTSEGAELALGFAMNGVADRDRILRKGGLRPGERLVLTKPVGTGTLFAADMRRQAKGRWIAAALASMIQSNREAARCVIRHGATACTDVTGFGLAGHLLEMLTASDVDAKLDLKAVPLLDGAEDAVRARILSSLQAENERVRGAIAAPGEVVVSPRFALLFDPQTAGGLLAGIPGDAADACVAELRAIGYSQAAIVGTIVGRGGGSSRIFV